MDDGSCWTKSCLGVNGKKYTSNLFCQSWMQVDWNSQPKAS